MDESASDECVTNDINVLRMHVGCFAHQQHGPARRESGGETQRAASGR